jgi:AcrR family transcriptional regulator
MGRTAAETREHVLQVTHDLFYWHGIRATGIDKVAAEAAVAPTTLYRLFGSKDDLVAAYVERADLTLRDSIAEAMQRAGSNPRDRILAIFDAQSAGLGPHEFRGCACLMAIAEFPEDALPGHQRAVAAKVWLRDVFAELAEQLSPNDSASLADHLMLIHEGVNACAQTLGAAGPAKSARALVEALLEARPARRPRRRANARQPPGAPPR